MGNALPGDDERLRVLYVLVKQRRVVDVLSSVTWILPGPEAPPTPRIIPREMRGDVDNRRFRMPV